MAESPFQKKPISNGDSPRRPAKPTFFRRPKFIGALFRRKEIPAGLWTKCKKCGEMIYDKELEENFRVCPKCGFHFPMSAPERIRRLLDPDSFQEMDAEMASVDALRFTGAAAYQEKLEQNREKTGLKDAALTGLGKLKGRALALAVMDFRFLGGSMGSVVGEKITRLIETAAAQRLPLVIVSSSGGARMYEGLLSLMQMAKTSAALAYFGRLRLPYISVLTHPTTAGVMASYASLGDLIVAEPGAMIGFAGPRVIKDTTQASLPPGFQTAEFLQEHGLIDAIIPRPQLRDRLAFFLEFLSAHTKEGARPASPSQPKAAS